MKYAAFAIILLAAGCVSVTSQTDVAFDFTGIRTIAVAQITGQIRGSARDQVGSMYEEQMRAAGYQTVNVITASARLREQGLEGADLTIPSHRERAAEVLKSEALLLVNIPRADDKVEMHARVIDSKTGSVLWSASGVADTQRNTIVVVATILGAATGAVIGKETTDEDAAAIIGGISGGVIGGMAGRALAPKAMQMMGKFVRKIMKDFPKRNVPPTREV